MGKIHKVNSLDEYTTERILQLWESSVRATHDFLSEKDIFDIKPQVFDGINNIEQLYCYFSEGNVIEAFLGVDGSKIEMLFVDAGARGKGIGTELVRYAVDDKGAEYVDVNEQNHQGHAFYEHIGFAVIGRSALDGQSRPFPILHMKYNR